MKTVQAGIDPQVQADHDAIMRHVIEGTPIDPALARRVEERASRITEVIWQKHGFIDVDQLLREARDEA